MDRLNLTERVRIIAEKATSNNALELVHVEIVGSGKRQTVRIFIDKEEGITHDHCSAVSQEVEETFESDDLIKDAYTLEVSSPGIERGLYKIEDFERFSDNAAKVNTHTAINNQKNFRGIIVGVKDENVVFDDRTNGTVEIPHAFIKKAKLKFDLTKELKKTKKRKS